MVHAATLKQARCNGSDILGQQMALPTAVASYQLCDLLDAPRMPAEGQLTALGQCRGAKRVHQFGDILVSYAHGVSV